MGVTWKADFAVGVLEIDAQHRELFARLDRLLEAIAVGHGGEEIFKTFEFLDLYTREHFTAEEALQLRYSYPQYEMHRAEHRHFIDSLDAIRAGYAQTGAMEVLMKRTSQTLQDWLITHICNTDRALAGYIAAHPLGG